MPKIKTVIPRDAKRIALRPLALGEKTGHHHSLYAEPGVCLEDAAHMFEVSLDGDAKKYFLRVTEEGVSLQHQEHKTQAVPPGEYEVVIQTEVTDWGRQRVAD
jgi:hypothetical protein